VKRIILLLTVTAMLLAALVASSALPALAQDSPPQPSCDWYLDNYLKRNFDVDWWGYWCDWGQDNGGWVLYGWWNKDTGWVPLS
jgi:hypothetical protein